jgi:hypothetical protein
MKRALLAVLMLAGCGLPEDPEGAAIIVQRDAVTTQSPAHVGYRPAARPSQAQQVSTASTLAVTLTGLPERGHVFATVGMLSCGFLEVGRGEGDLSNGTVNLDITLQPQTSGDSWTLFFFVDENHDGQCTTETPHAAKLPQLPTHHVQFDLSALPPSYGAGCWAFQ